MPTTVFQNQKSVDNFTAALIEVGGSVSRVVELRTFRVVKYKLPKKAKSEKKKKVMSLEKAPKPR